MNLLSLFKKTPPLPQSERDVLEAETTILARGSSRGDLGNYLHNLTIFEERVGELAKSFNVSEYQTKIKSYWEVVRALEKMPQIPMQTIEDERTRIREMQELYSLSGGP